MDGIILVDKKENMTSYDVIRKVKRYFNTSKTGHCGTLDPFATGLLIIGINQATKVLSFLESEYKEYEATISFGKFYDSYDKTGNLIKESTINPFTKAKINEVLKSFIGKSWQTPPIYSAIHVNGKRLYDYARNNETVDIKSREIEIFDIKLLGFTNDSISIYVKCSKGTYIRSLGVDIAKKLNNDGYLSSLRRISIGTFKADIANKIEDFNTNSIIVHPISEMLNIKNIVIEDEYLHKIYNGHLMNFNSDDKYLLINRKDGTSIAIYTKNDNNYRCLRGLFNEETRYK